MIPLELAFLLKSALIALGVVASLLAYTPLATRILEGRHAVALVLLAFVALRVAAFVGIYSIGPGGVSSSDLVLHYLPQAQSAASGLIPYNEFETSYGPLFPYLVGILLPLSRSPASVAAVVLLCELACVVVLAAALRRAGDPALPRTLWLYSVNPAVMYWTSVCGYNGCMLALFWSLGLLLRERGRPRTGLVTASLSVFAVKFLGFLALPAWGLDRRVGLVGGLAVGLAIAAVVAALHAAGLDLLMPARVNLDLTTPGNLWFLASSLVEVDPKGWIWRFGPPLAFLLAAGALFLGARARLEERPPLGRLIAAISALNLLFMLLLKKTYAFYAPMFLLFTCYVTARHRRRLHPGVAALLATTSLGLFTPSLWNELGQPAFLRASFAGSQAAVAGFLFGLDFVIALSNLWLVKISVASCIGGDGHHFGSGPDART